MDELKNKALILFKFSKLQTSDPNRSISFTLVFFFVLPKLFSTPVCGPPNVRDEQVLGAVLLSFHLDLPGQLLPFTQGLCHFASHASRLQ